MAFRGIIPKRSIREDLQIMDAMASQETRNPVSSKVRSRFQMLGVIVCAVGVFVGLHVAKGRQANATVRNFAHSLLGTWELRSVHGDPVGPKEDSSVILQRVTFEDGVLRGTTRLRANTAAATSAMPFPDSSAKHVSVSVDGRYVDVTWEGTYTVLDANRLELRVGKAVYLVEAQINATTHHLTFDHDAILTFPGIAEYVEATSLASRKSNESIE